MKAKKGVNFIHKLQLGKGSSFSELKGGPNECYRSVPNGTSSIPLGT